MATSPSSSHASGGLPSQWTNGGRGDVIVKVDDASKLPLTVEGAHNETNDIFDVQSFDTSLALAISGDNADGVGAVVLQGSSVLLQRSAGNGQGIILQGNGIFFGFANSDPGNLVTNSQFAFWLDDTPGATKLMIKATDSGGTVRTAAIALA